MICGSIMYLCTLKPGACPGFFKGGGGPISLGSLKKGHQILKGGGEFQWSDGGSSTFVSLGGKILHI